MNIEQKEKFAHIQVTSDFETFTSTFPTAYNTLKNQNIVIDFLAVEVSEAQINTLFPYAEQQAENDTSFVIIVKEFDADVFEEGLNVVPTLIEAEDIIDMDDMTRALDF